MKTSEAFRIAQRCVLCQMEIKTNEQVDEILEVLAILRKEEEMALHLEQVRERVELNATF